MEQSTSPEPILKCERCGQLTIISARRLKLPNKQRFCSSKCAFAWHNSRHSTGAQPTATRKQSEIYAKIQALPAERRAFLAERLRMRWRAHAIYGIPPDANLAGVLVELFEVCELDDWQD